MPSLDAALTAPCPTCYVPAGQSCRSRHAVTLHQSRRQALAGLGVQADVILAADRQQRRAAPGPAGATPPVPVLVGRTGEDNVIPETAEYWPPWEEPPVPGCLAESGIPVTGLVWCPVHEDYEELCDGVPAVRLHVGIGRSVIAPAGASAPAHREPAPVRQPRPGACGVGRASEE